MCCWAHAPSHNLSALREILSSLRVAPEAKEVCDGVAQRRGQYSQYIYCQDVALTLPSPVEGEAVTDIVPTSVATPRVIVKPRPKHVHRRPSSGSAELEPWSGYTTVFCVFLSGRKADDNKGKHKGGGGPHAVEGRPEGEVQARR